MDATIADQRGLSSSRICTGTRGSGGKEVVVSGRAMGWKADWKETEEKKKKELMLDR